MALVLTLMTVIWLATTYQVVTVRVKARIQDRQNTLPR